jgi:hypothetical protein
MSQNKSNSSKDTRLMITRLVSTLEEVHESLDQGADKVDPYYAMGLIEDMLESYKDIYGKDAKRGTN